MLLTKKNAPPGTLLLTAGSYPKAALKLIEGGAKFDLKGYFCVSPDVNINKGVAETAPLMALRVVCLNRAASSSKTGGKKNLTKNKSRDNTTAPNSFSAILSA